MAGERIRVGIIGANVRYGWGMRAHMPAVLALPEYELAAVCTARPETAEESANHYGARLAFHDYNEMVNHPDIDLVTVCVRAPLHHSMVMAGLEAGKHIFCEWPLGANLAETEELASLARKKDGQHMIGLQARGEAALLRIPELLAEGFVGEVLACNMTMFMPGILERGLDGPWRADRENGVNTLSISARHSIDALCFCVGDFTELSARVTTQVPEWETSEPGKKVKVTSPDNVLVSGLLSNGAVASVHVATVPKLGTGWRMEVYGREGTLVASAPQMVMFGQVQLRGGRGGDGALEDLTVPDRLTWVPGEVPQGVPFNVAQLYRRLGEAIQGARSAEPDFDLAVKRHRLLDAIQRSSDQGIKVQVS